MQIQTINAQRSEELSPESWINPLKGLSKIKVSDHVSSKPFPMEVTATSALMLFKDPSRFTQTSKK